MRRYIDLVESLSKEPVSEAPIDNLELVGDFNKSSAFRHADDRKLLTNPKAIQKIKNLWRNTDVPFDIYCINHPDATRNPEVGEVSQKWLKENMPRVFPMLKIRPEAVTILFNGNSGADRVPLTGWVMAHRFGHAVRLKEHGIRTNLPDFKDANDELFRAVGTILQSGYDLKVPLHGELYLARHHIPGIENLYEKFFEHIGTMRSAREKKLRTPFEFLYELLAQYITVGRIKFNPLPDVFSYRVGNNTSYVRWAGTEYDKQYYGQGLDDLAESLEAMFDNLLHHCVGRVFVI